MSKLINVKLGNSHKKLQKIFNQTLTLSVLVMTFHSVSADDLKQTPIYQNTAMGFQERAKDLVAHMTLEEKLPQLTNDAPAIPRLGVREYNWWNEGLFPWHLKILSLVNIGPAPAMTQKTSQKK